MTTEIDTITDDVVDAWQSLVDTLARAVNVPAALIMRVTGEEIEVFVSSDSDGNPYTPGDRETLFDSGLYCETVIRTQRELLVPDALADPEWRENPDVELGMISYLGLPIRYPDGRPFGTICVLDGQENAYSRIYREILEQFRNVVEAELGLITMARDLDGKNRELEAALDEVRKLRSIIPLCMGCKKVRDDDGYWSRLEAYLLTHQNIATSHSLCPECAEKWKEELDREMAGDLESSGS